MEICHTLIKFFLVLFLQSASGLNCIQTRRNQADGNNIIIQENTFANFIHPLTATSREPSRKSAPGVINIVICDNGTQSIVCRCRWGSDNDIVCKNESDFSVCDADSPELRFSLLVRRTYTYVMCEIFDQNFSPRLLTYTELKVTYPPIINSLLVNGEQVNETYFINDGEQPEVYCSYSNGNPPVSLRLSDDRRRMHRVSKSEEDHVTITFDTIHCHHNWPVVRCEAGGSELNRSVLIAVRCPPQFSNVSSETFDLSRFTDGLKINIRSHTANISKCWMRDLSLGQANKAPINCNISGIPPYFTLTLRFKTESWDIEGNWTMFVGNEAGTSNMTFTLRNNALPQSQTTSRPKNQTWVISLGSVLGVAVAVAMAFLCFVKLMNTHKLAPSSYRSTLLQTSPGADNSEASRHDAGDKNNETSGHGVSAWSFDVKPQTFPSWYGIADGLIYCQLDFADWEPSDIIIGSVPETQHAKINL